MVAIAIATGATCLARVEIGKVSMSVVEDARCGINRAERERRLTKYNALDPHLKNPLFVSTSKVTAKHQLAKSSDTSYRPSLRSPSQLTLLLTITACHSFSEEFGSLILAR